MNTIKSRQRVAGHGEVFTTFDILPPLAYIWTSTASTTPLRKQNNDRSAWPRQTLARPTETHGASMALRNGDRAVRALTAHMGHYPAWRGTARELFEGEETGEALKEARIEYGRGLGGVNEDLGDLSAKEIEFLLITTKAYLCLSGTPFRALATGEFIEEQIFNWTYTDELRAQQQFAAAQPGRWNPYAALPQVRLLIYQMPDELLTITGAGEFDEFDLNAFFEASGTGEAAQFRHKDEVQKWLDIIRGGYLPKSVEHLKTGTRPPGWRRSSSWSFTGLEVQDFHLLVRLKVFNTEQ